MDPTSRIVKRIEIDDPVSVDEYFSILMGDKVETRREFIGPTPVEVPQPGRVRPADHITKQMDAERGALSEATPFFVSCCTRSRDARCHLSRMYFPECNVWRLGEGHKTVLCL
jgi:hypothetical protein